MEAGIQLNESLSVCGVFDQVVLDNFGKTSDLCCITCVKTCGSI